MKGLTQRAGRALLFAATAFVVPGVYPSVAAAQTAGGPAASTGGGINEVVVTARGRGERVQDVPIAITAITTQLEKADLRDLRDVVAYTPNVRIDDINLRPGAPSVLIRGISPSRTDDNTIDSPIGVLIDGVYLGSLPGQIVDNFDVARIEVLRGPQGTLFGRNTIGGALNVIRTDPTGEWGGKAQYTTGSFNDQEFRLVVNAPIIEGVLAAKGYYFSANRDGYLTNTFQNSSNPQRQYQNFGVTLKWTPSDTVTSLLTVEKFDDRSQSGGGLGNYNVIPGVLAPPTQPSDFNQPDGSLPGGLTIGTFLPGLFGLTNLPPRTSLALPDTTTVDYSPKGSVQTTALTWNNKWQVNPHLQVVSVSGYRDQSEFNGRDFDGTSAPFINITTDADYSQFTQEFRLEGDWNTAVGHITAVGGLYYFQSSFTRNWVTSGQFWNFIGLLGGYNFANNTWLSPALAAATGFATPIQACIAPRTAATTAVFGRTRCDPTVTTAYGPAFPAKLYESQDTESYAAFAHADWEFLPKWTLTLGTRYTAETKDFTGYQAYVTPTAQVNAFHFPASLSLSRDFVRMTPMAALSYKATEDLMFYGSYSEGWHSGGFFGVNQNIEDFISNQYNPETARSGELGVKSQWLDDHLQLNVTAFRNDFKNKQESAIVFDATTNTVVTLFTNVGGLRYQGLEAELQWIITDQLDVSATLGYLDAKYTDLMIGYPGNKTGPVPIVNATFLIPRNAPEYTLGAAINYTIPIGPGELALGTRFNWVDDIYGDIYNTSTSFVDAHENVSASASYSFGKYKVSLFGQNLTDYQNEAAIFIAPLFASSNITAPRTWGIEVQAKF